MAGVKPTFLNGALVAIKINGRVFAYAQGLSFSDTMDTVPVGGLGSYSYHNLEPISYSCRGSLQVLQYSGWLLKNSPGITLPENMAFDRANAPSKDSFFGDGNSLLFASHFSPLNLVTSQTFDIEILQRNVPTDVLSNTDTLAATSPLAIIRDVRFNSFSMSFAPGQILSQTVSFVALSFEQF